MVKGVNPPADHKSAYTGPGNYGFADFIIDEASSANIAGAAGPFGQRQWRDAAYIQDDWKILPNLTLNLGVRYAYDQPIYEVNNKMVGVNLPLHIRRQYPSRSSRC